METRFEHRTNSSAYDKSVRVHSKIKLAETQLQKTVVDCDGETSI